MHLSLSRGFRRTATLALATALSLGAPALAMFPPPFYNPPPVRVNGDPSPEIPVLPPPSTNVPPPPDPCSCGCPTHTQSTPEPTTIISSLLGATMLAGYALRRSKK
jgi:hypothetical protein